jgi:hypothetical protein
MKSKSANTPADSKMELEATLFQIISDFENSTGLHVTKVRLHRTHGTIVVGEALDVSLTSVSTRVEVLTE